MPLVLAAMFFAACILDHDQRLRIMAQYVETAAKRLFGIPDFKHYALADGMSALFSRHPGKPERVARAPARPPARTGPELARKNRENFGKVLLTTWGP